MATTARADEHRSRAGAIARTLDASEQRAENILGSVRHLPDLVPLRKDVGAYSDRIRLPRGPAGAAGGQGLIGARSSRRAAVSAHYRAILCQPAAPTAEESLQDAL